MYEEVSSLSKRLYKCKQLQTLIKNKYDFDRRCVIDVNN